MLVGCLQWCCLVRGTIPQSLETVLGDLHCSVQNTSLYQCSVACLHQGCLNTNQWDNHNYFPSVGNAGNLTEIISMFWGNFQNERCICAHVYQICSCKHLADFETVLLDTNLISLDAFGYMCRGIRNMTNCFSRLKFRLPNSSYLKTQVSDLYSLKHLLL